jgi:hypothetical protein
METISNAIVSFEYEDTENGFRQTRTLTLAPDNLTTTIDTTVIKDAGTEFSYTFKLFRKDGSILEKTDQTAALGDIVTLGETARNSMEVIVDASTIDWTAWRMAFVKLTYTPPSGAASKSETLRFDLNANPIFEWQVLTEEISGASYMREATFISTTSSERRTIGPESSSEPFFIVDPEQGGGENA